MFNVTIIKLKDIIKIGVILILIYVFSNFVFKVFKNQKALNNLSKNNSVAFIKKSIENESSIIYFFSKTQDTSKETIKPQESINKLIDISSVLTIGANIFSLNQMNIEGHNKNRY